MRSNGLLVTLRYKEHLKVVELFPNIQMINAEEIFVLDYFRQTEIIATVIDVDNFMGNSLEEIITKLRKYHIHFIFVSTQTSVLAKLAIYGDVVLNDINLVEERIIAAYSKRVSQVKGGYTFNYKTRIISNANYEWKVTNTPFLIFNYLVTHKNKVCSREEIIEEIYEYELEHGTKKPKMLSEARNVDVHIHSLRKKIGDDRIKTVVNEGYIFEDDEDNEKKQ